MKKYFLLISSLILLSCSSEKIEKEIINTLLDKSIKKENINNSFLVEESVSKIKALEYYKIAFSDRNKENNYRRIIANNNYNIWPIDSLEINQLKKEIMCASDTLTKKWKSENINNNEFKIIKYNLIKESIKNGSSSLNIEAIKLSKPLLDKSKRNALIFYSSFGYFIGGETQDKVFLLQKVNNKWEIITYFYNPKIMN